MAAWRPQRRRPPQARQWQRATSMPDGALRAASSPGISHACTHARTYTHMQLKSTRSGRGSHPASRQGECVSRAAEDICCCCCCCCYATCASSNGACCVCCNGPESQHFSACCPALPTPASLGATQQRRANTGFFGSAVAEAFSTSLPRCHQLPSSRMALSCLQGPDPPAVRRISDGHRRFAVFVWGAGARVLDHACARPTQIQY